jgi:FkbH-like protein
MHTDLRAAVDRAIDKGDKNLALAGLHRLMSEAPSIANAQFVLDRASAVSDSGSRLRLRVAILRSCTVEPVVPMLRAAALLHGVNVDVWVGGFNSYAQELLDPDSGLDGFQPDVVILAVQTRDLVPQLWNTSEPIEASAGQALVNRTIRDIRDWIDAFRSRSHAHVVVQNFEVPDATALGILDSQSSTGQRGLVKELNSVLVGVANESTGVHVLDYDGLIARHGRRRWRDERKWLMARMPVAAECLMPLAQEYLRYLLPLAGRTAKALVVDLDNTLWGGVVGEDGADGIQVGPEYPGAGFQELQKAILAVRARGIVLAIASKNNSAEALEVLDRHPGMLLRSGDFASTRINWNEKAESLKEIAAELNIGVDSLAFLDDSSIERERIRLELPQVTVVELPADSMLYAQALLDCPELERLSLTDEDRARGRLYEEQRRRSELQQGSASLEGFLHSLEIEMEMREMDPDSLPRVSQLTQKTNQFNLTTRRYSEQELHALAADPSARVYQVRVRDRFGDNGIVGVAITRSADGFRAIDSFLLSCRVIGRTLETAMLAQIASDALDEGTLRLRGWFLSTRKNAPASEFYASHGFTLLESGDGASHWELDLEAHRPRCPEWIVCNSN